MAERAQTRDDLREALTHLPSIDRTAVVLHDAGGLTAAEIAQTTGAGIPPAKQRQRRGRMVLVSTLADAPHHPEGTADALLGCPITSQRHLDRALHPGPAHAPRGALA